MKPLVSLLRTMSIKTGFILGIAIFLIFVLFKNQIANATFQIIFVVAFILAEITIIALVFRRLR